MPPKRAPALARLDLPRLGLSLELRIILKKSVRRLRLYTLDDTGREAYQPVWLARDDNAAARSREARESLEFLEESDISMEFMSALLSSVESDVGEGGVSPAAAAGLFGTVDGMMAEVKALVDRDRRAPDRLDPDESLLRDKASSDERRWKQY